MTNTLRRAGMALLAIAAATPAFAHAHLASSSPAKDAVIAAAPESVTLTFTEPLELKFSAVAVAGPDQKPVQTGAATHGKSDDGKVLEVPFAAPLAPGKYVVDWRVLSKDGHKMKGSYAFTVKPQ